MVTAKEEKNYIRDRSMNIVILIETAKVKQHMNNKELAEYLNISSETLWSRMKEPGTFKLSQIWALMMIAEVPDEEKYKYL